MRKYFSKLVILYILSFAVSVLPVFLTLIIKWDDYTTTPAQTVKLCFGGMLALCFVGLKVIGKLKIPSRIIFFGLVFIMSYLCQALLKDLVLLSGMALIGEVLDALIFQNWIKKLKEEKAVEKTADATTEKVKEVLDEYLSGRT